MEPFSTRVSDVLASSEFLQRHPGNSMLGSDLYSSASNSTSEIILRQRYSGQYRIDANNLQFGSQSAFFISSGSIMNALIISGAVTLPQYAKCPDLFGLHAIDSCELSISGSSSVQSLKISGRSMLDYLLCSCHSSKVEAMKEANSFVDLKDVPGGRQIRFSIPLHLFFSSPEIVSVFPLDTSTLQSQIILNIRWKQGWNFISGETDHAITLPTQFDFLYMRVVAQNIISNNFALATELKQDSQLIYSLPGTYLQTYSEIQNVAAVGLGVSENQVQLSSQPSGMLQMILVSAQSVAQEGSIGTQTLIQPWAQFETVRVLYNGIELVRFDSAEEGRLFNCIYTDKDSGVHVKLRNQPSNSSTLRAVQLNSPSVYIVPFSNEVSKILRDRRHEHTKNYSGSTIQFFYTMSVGIENYTQNNPIIGSEYHTDASTFTLAQPTGQYRLNFTFVNSSLYEISSQTVSMTM